MPIKKIALVGSSGGNLFNQGGHEPQVMFSELQIQASSVDIDVRAVSYVSADRSMDGSTKGMRAELYCLRDGELSKVGDGPLESVNNDALSEDQAVADEIRAGNIDGLIVLSGDPGHANHASINAAALMGIPVVGTGGTSMAKTGSMGARVICASGTTGTTNKTRAISFISAFAHEWKLPYSPVLGLGPNGARQNKDGLLGLLKQMKLHGVLMSAMPVYIAFAVLCALANSSVWAFAGPFQEMVHYAIPVILSVLTARKISGMDEIGCATGVIAGLMCMEGGTIGGLLAGIVAGVFTYYLATFSLRLRMPGTMVNVVSGCVGGLAGGALSHYLLLPASRLVTDFIIDAIHFLTGFLPFGFGAVLGLLMWLCILRGFYHQIILPLVFIEMGETGFSFFGAIDMVCLVTVSVGIMFANSFLPVTKNSAPIARQGLKLNILYGTFVEASYPYILSSRAVYVGTMLAAAVGGGLASMLGIHGTAYIPTVVAPFLSSGGVGNYLVCMGCAFGVSFIWTALANLVAIHRGK
jgi:hypothetical protein